jgi:ribose 5-phosphate isomerase A
LREKVVAYSSSRVAIVVGRAKLVARLGTTFRLPIEVIPFARSVVERAVRAAGAEPELRGAAAGKPYLTDNGNEILDCKFPGGIADPAALEAALDRIPGIVETGLFIDLAHVAVIGDEDGTCEVREKQRS